MSDRRPFLPEDLVRTRRLSGLDCSPDGRWAVAALDELSADGKSWDTNLYRIDLSEPSSEPVALTADTRKKGSPRFRADGLLGFLCEPDAAERRDEPGETKEKEKPKRQLHLLDPGGGAPRRITDLPGGVQDYRWSADGRRLAMLSPVHPESRDLEHEREVRKERSERRETGVVHEGWPLRFWDRFLGPDFAHLIVAGGDGEEPRDLTPGLAFGMHESALAISPDGSTIAVDWHGLGEGRRIEAWMALIDAETGERRDLRPEGPADAFGPRFSPDGRRLAYLVHPRVAGATGKQDVVVHELESGDERTLTADIDLWPAELEWVDDETLAWSADEAGRHRLFVQRVDEDGARAVSGEGVVQNWCLLPGGEAALAGINRFHAPAEVHRLLLDDGAEPLPLTGFNAGWLEGRELPRGESHELTGADGRTIQAWELKPPGFDPAKKHPLLVWIHGGPLGSYRDEFHYRWNAALFAEAGHVVVMVNPAGSTGFGQEIVESNHAKWGDVCYRDVMAAADRWCAEDWIDETRTAALGASFGGYMINWIAGSTDRFRCLVCHAGLFHLPAFNGTTDVGPNWEREFGGPHWEDASRWEANSPHRNAGSWKTPTLVIHGELDYRVPLGEGLGAYHALQRLGVESKFLYFPDENHWILKPANMVQWNREVLGWLERHLLAG